MIDVVELTKRFDSSPVLEGVSLRIEKGDRKSVV